MPAGRIKRNLNLSVTKMATPELAPGKKYDFDGVHIEGVSVDGEACIVTTSDGWKRRIVDIDINEHGGHIDGYDDEDKIPAEEKARFLGSIATFVRTIAPEVIGQSIITVEDPDGNLI